MDSLGVSSVIVIPARLESTRLPRKLLLRETGKSVLQHTYESAAKARRPSALWVAADDSLIVDDVRAFGGNVELTSPTAANGTDRVAELAARLPPVDVIVNVQGDEPEISGEAIDLAIELLERDPEAVMSTLATPIRTREKLDDPACVKVVCDGRQRAMYFSRSPIPHAREWDDSLLTASPPHFLQHIGLYAYRREFLLRIAQLPPCALEQLERLEQLRVLMSGHAIQVGVIDEPSIGVDTLADYRAFVERIRNRTMSAPTSE
jgi:3-deoxy-manno-octulosonate cytidylyltransferase (CMP-KDO synthetase)